MTGRDEVISEALRLADVLEALREYGSVPLPRQAIKAPGMIRRLVALLDLPDPSAVPAPDGLESERAPDPDELLTTSESAVVLGLSGRMSVIRYVRRGILTPTHTTASGRLLFSRSYLLTQQDAWDAAGRELQEGAA